jgi:2'-5' RNA ligase
MEGIVTLLDPEHDALVRGLWLELEAALGLRGVWVTPFPHFSYQVAQRYDQDRLQLAVRALAAAAQPFEARVAGLALFTGPAPVLYLPVVRTAALSAWHQRVWEACLPAAREPLDYYHPDRWVPHITIGFGDLDADRAAEAVRLLAGRAFDWPLKVDNLAFGADDGTAQGLKWQVPLLL